MEATALHSPASFFDTQPFRWTRAARELKGKLPPPFSGWWWLGNPFWPKRSWAVTGVAQGLLLGRDNNRGRAGWQQLSQERGFHINNELLPARAGGDSSPPLRIPPAVLSGH